MNSSTTKLYIGLNDKDYKRQLKDTNVLKQLVYDTIFKHGFDCFTLQFASGVYKHTSGEIVEENTFIVTFIDQEYTIGILDLVEDLNDVLNQECILIETYASNSFLKFSK